MSNKNTGNLEITYNLEQKSYGLFVNVLTIETREQFLQAKDELLKRAEEWECLCREGVQA